MGHTLATGSRGRLEDERHANGASAPVAAMQAALAADAVVDLPFQMLVQVWLRQWVRGKGDMVCIIYDVGSSPPLRSSFAASSTLSPRAAKQS